MKKMKNQGNLNNKDGVAPNVNLPAAQQDLTGCSDQFNLVEFFILHGPKILT
ncbi:hypothetical protein UPYG_G00044470 [Umbra pygmaea]|uniref:Uncharacterized protein n=1 Tax=Umbra pygmaea TaxID=75934 RepID=A0ABD0XQQ0_UMBPY